MRHSILVSWWLAIDPRTHSTIGAQDHPHYWCHGLLHPYRHCATIVHHQALQGMVVRVARHRAYIAIDEHIDDLLVVAEQLSLTSDQILSNASLNWKISCIGGIVLVGLGELIVGTHTHTHTHTHRKKEATE
jgi:hypothetical protein